MTTIVKEREMGAVATIHPNAKSQTLAEAFLELQSAIKPAIKDATNPAFKSRYADLGAVWEAIKEPLKASGFSIIQSPDFDASDMWLTTTLLHKSGEKISGRYPIRPTKNDPQGYGSALTYARRYSISAMLGVIADDDDDGNAASAGPRATNGKVTEDQAKVVRDLIARTETDVEAFCKHFKIEAVPDLPAGKFSTAIEMLNMKAAKK